MGEGWVAVVMRVGLEVVVMGVGWEMVVVEEKGWVTVVLGTG